MKTKLLLFSIVTPVLVSCGGNEVKQNKEPLAVETETIGEHSFDCTRWYVGQVEAESSTSVSFNSMGTITEIFVSEGQHVSKGQVIARIDDSQNRHAVEAAQASVNQAEDAYARMKVLHDANSLSDMDWVEVQSKVQQARASLDMAKKSLDDCTLKAPCSGVIGCKHMESGMTALPSEPICQILNINKVKVKVSIPEKEIGRISASTPTRITIDAIDRTFVGGRVEKGVQADAMTHTYDIRISLANPGEALLPGMVADVGICGEQTDSLVTLPVRCIQQSTDGRNYVWVVRKGRAQLCYVALGATFGNRIEIVSGLGRGDKVIVGGYQKVGEGDEVRC